MTDFSQDKLEDSIEWKKTPEPPVPGFYRMDMIPNVDIKKHDASIDNDFKRIHSLYTEFFPVDILDELKKLDNPISETWLRQDEQIDDRYFREQSDRRDHFKREQENTYIEDVKDYQKYVKDSFEDVEKVVSGYEVVEEYPLFPSFEEPYVLIIGDVGNGSGFTNEKGESTLKDRCFVDDKQYECMKQRVGDNVIIEIKDGKAYYIMVPYIYKFKQLNVNSQ